MTSTLSAASTFSKDRFILLEFPKRQEGIPYDNFFTYWSQVHAPHHVCLDSVQANTRRYEHIYKDVSKSEELLKDYGMQPLPYDGLIIHEASSYEKLATWTDKAFVSKTAADSVKFVEPKKALVLGQIATFVTKPSTPVKGVREDRVRLVAFIRRKPGMSVQEFQKHWGEVHSKVYSNLAIVQKNITLYEQIHVDHGVTSELSIKLDYSAPPYDGIAIFEAESYDKIFEVLLDPEYLSVGAEDESRFLDKESVIILPGKFEVFL